ncbi:MAG: hypothetical protein H0X12_04055 [Nocardioides sp.]|nr:hypothetical protein [Nocardioides sp.]
MGTITVPIVAQWGGKDYKIGDLTLDVKVVNGKPRLPSEREIRATLRKGLR